MVSGEQSQATNGPLTISKSCRSQHEGNMFPIFVLFLFCVRFWSQWICKLTYVWLCAAVCQIIIIIGRLRWFSHWLRRDGVISDWWAYVRAQWMAIINGERYARQPDIWFTWSNWMYVCSPRRMVRIPSLTETIIYQFTGGFDGDVEYVLAERTGAIRPTCLCQVRASVFWSAKWLWHEGFIIIVDGHIAYRDNLRFLTQFSFCCVWCWWERHIAIVAAISQMIDMKI